MSNIKKGSKLTVSTANGISRASSNNLGVLEVSGPGLSNVVSQDSTFSLSSSNVPQFTIGATDNSGIFQLGLDNQGNAVLESTLNGSNKNILIQQLGGYVGIGTTNPASTLHVKSSDAIIIPVGTNNNRPGESGQITAQNGMIRYNTTTSQFEGYGPGSAWGSLGGVKDVDGDTYILAETSAGNDNDDLQFFTAGSQRMVILDSGNVGIGGTDNIGRLNIKGGGILLRQSSVYTGSRPPAPTINQQMAYDYEICSRYDNSKGFLRLIAGLDSNNSRIELSAHSGSVSHDTDRNIAFFTNNTEQMRINYQGNVGIGTTNPTGGKLHVVGDIYTTGKILGQVGGSSLIVGGSTYQSATAPTNGMLVEGNVGIGTTSPGSKLHVYGNQSVYLQGSTRPCIFYYKGATSGGTLKWVVGMNEDPAENYSITGLNSAGHILLNPTGNVGIGTTSPDAKLHIKGGNLIIERPNTEVPRIELIRNNSSNDFGGDNYQDWAIQNSGGNFQLISGHQSNGNTTVLTSDGTNVGIGTTSPYGKVEISDDWTNNGNDEAKAYLNFSNTNATYPSRWQIGPWKNGAGHKVFGIRGGGSTTDFTALNSLFTVNYDGYVGINQETNLSMGTGFKLQVNGHGVFCNNGDKAESLSIGDNGIRAIIESRSTTHNLEFWVNGSSRLAIKADGNVGIGTTSPSQKLDILGTGGTGTGRIRFTDTDTATEARNWFVGPFRSSDACFAITPSASKGGTSPDTTKTFQISYNGNVGIGTTSPKAKFESSCGSFSGAGENSPQTSNQTTAFLNVSAFFSRTNTTNNNHFGLVIGHLADTGRSYLQTLSMNNTAYYDLLLQPSGGNVGIGTTSPYYKLEVNGSSWFGSNMKIKHACLLSWANPGNNTTSSDHYLSAIKGDATNKNLQFHVNNNERMRIIADGNVGIGTTSPSARLQINATAVDPTTATISGSSSQGGLRLQGIGPSTFMDFGMALTSPYGGWIQTHNGVNTDETGEFILLQPVRGSVVIGSTGYDALTNKLEVKGGNLLVRRDGSNDTAQIAIRGGGGHSSYLRTQSDGKFILNSYDSTKTMTLQSHGGNVGIGTTAPNEKLNVNTSSTNATDVIYPLKINNQAMHVQTNTGGGVGIRFGLYDNAVTDHRYSQIAGISEDIYSNKTAIAFYTNSSVATPPPEVMRIDGNGNVGIGTDDPRAELSINSGKLCFQGSTFNETCGISYYHGTSSSERKLLYFGSSGQMYIQAADAAGNEDGIYFRDYYGTDLMYIRGNDGGVGIGTTNPDGYKLYVKHDGSAWSSIYTTGEATVYLAHGGGYGLAIETTKDTSSTYGFNIANLSGTWCRAYNNKVFKIFNNGYLQLANIYGDSGLGYHATGYGKHNWYGTEHWAGNTSASAGSYGDYDAWNYYGTYDFVYLGKIHGALISTNGFIHLSDERIKRDIEDVPDHESLNKVLAIEVRKYGYQDYINRGTYRVTGFIAQEVLKVFPEAVSTNTDGVLPNIYKISTGYNYDISENKLILDVSGISLTEDIKIDSKIQLKLMNHETLFDENIDVYLKEVNDTNIVVECNENITEKIEKTQEIFIFGSHVNNIHTVNKDKIFTIHHGAIQEIYRIQQQEITKIQTLQTDLSNANTIIQTHETTIQEQSTKITTLETQIADILTRLSNLENTGSA